LLCRVRGLTVEDLDYFLQCNVTAAVII